MKTIELLKVTFILILLNGSLFIKSVYAQWTYEQKFNTLPDVNLNGQDGWSKTSEMANELIVSTDTAARYEGAKGLLISGYTVHQRTISDFTSGILYFALKVKTTNSSDDGPHFTLKNGSNYIFVIKSYMLGGILKLQYFSNNTYTSIQTISTNTWYLIGINFDGANHRYAYNINNGSWSSWLETGTPGQTTANGITIGCDSWEGYFDYISPNYLSYTPPAPPTPTTVDWNNSNVQEITLAADRSLVFANGNSGGLYTFIIKQDGTGGKNIIWPSNIGWVVGTAPTLTATPNAIDIIKFVYDGSHYLATGVTLDIRY
ncbi:MAG: hypothetical protein HGB12_01175 [Bacteroidetes bacterium]|nr:hypothetical protein [Bacteroidota bacterium]